MRMSTPPTREEAMSLARLLSGSRHGVFRCQDQLDAERSAVRAGWLYVLLDTSPAAEREEFLDCCAEAFDLPRSVADSWEGLDQCLRGLDFDEPAGLLVVWHGWAVLADSDPNAFDCALEVFRDACVAWHDDEVPGAVVLVGPGPETDLPDL